MSQAARDRRAASAAVAPRRTSRTATTEPIIAGRNSTSIRGPASTEVPSAAAYTAAASARTTATSIPAAVAGLRVTAFRPCFRACFRTCRSDHVGTGRKE
ncbi:hypothetical protein YW3DRAFT_01561 [Streptomyces sp. MnatMP-M77]|nr:hypothetical protein SACT1_3092 [Streptomyces sp. ACT-1]SBV00624.1 hypothetical protein YW3DRAFT_01561 [Streptomyces sp. MnatMP-M77]